MNDVGLTILIIALAAFVIGAIVYFSRKRKLKKAQESTLNNLPVKLPATWAVTIDRPNTPYIRSVVDVPESAITQIIAGIQKQIETTPESWRAVRSVFDYNVYFINPDTLNQDGSPALFIHGIQSAGTCIGVANDGYGQPFIVLPHQQAQAWAFEDYLKASARNESEHFAEWLNDRTAFFSFIGAGDRHPHYPDENGN